MQYTVFCHTNTEATCPEIEDGQICCDRSANKQYILFFLFAKQPSLILKLGLMKCVQLSELEIWLQGVLKMKVPAGNSEKQKHLYILWQ